MHPDLKVGLALAMLIVGFAGAMCFRHRPVEVAAQQSELDRATNLDDELELLPVRTYLPERTRDGDEEDPLADSDNSMEPDVLDPHEEQIVLDPIGSGLVGSQGPANVVEASQSTETEPSHDESPTVYTVRPGDTLSGISARLLGSTQRYQEIFDANRNQLNSPDDLRPGMELTIPPKVPPAEALTEPDGTSETEATSPPEPTPVTARRFTPIVPR